MHAEGQFLLWVLVQLLPQGECLGDHLALLDPLGLVVAAANDPGGGNKSRLEIRNLMLFYTKSDEKKCPRFRSFLQVKPSSAEKKKVSSDKTKTRTQKHKRLFTPQRDACLLAPGPLPDEDGGLGPDPGAHGDACTKHGEQVDLLHHETGPVLDVAFWDWLVGLRGDGHVGFAPVGKNGENVSLMHQDTHVHMTWKSGGCTGKNADAEPDAEHMKRRGLVNLQHVFPEAPLPLSLAEEVIEVAGECDGNKSKSEESENP